jgi:hypothetical protein
MHSRQACSQSREFPLSLSKVSSCLCIVLQRLREAHRTAGSANANSGSWTCVAVFEAGMLAVSRVVIVSFRSQQVAVALCCSASAKLTGLLDQRMQTVAPGLALQYSTRSSRWLHCCVWLRCGCVEGLVDSGLEILVRYLPWSHQTDMSQDSHDAFLPGKIAEQS